MKTALQWLSILLIFFLAACQPPEPGDFDQEIEQPQSVDVPELDLGNFPPAYMHEIIHPQPGEVINQSPYLITYSGTSFAGINQFEVWVNGSLVGTSPVLGSGSGGPAYGHFFYSEYEWTPVGHGERTIAVRAVGTGVQNYSEFLEVQVTVAPSLTVNVIPEVPEMAAPWVEPLFDQPCYFGPDLDGYDIAGYLVMGESAPIVAQDLTGDWWVIENQDAEGTCYVRKADNEANGDTSGLPTWRDLVDDGPTCTQNLDQNACVEAGGSWVDPVGRTPYCDCP